jgi:hypothetical protein
MDPTLRFPVFNFDGICNFDLEVNAAILPLVGLSRAFGSFAAVINTIGP